MRKFVAIACTTSFVLAVVAGAPSIASTASAAEMFHAISFEEALAKAAKEKKWVFVDFYTTWCMPCKMLDNATLKDAGVTKWLKDNAVAVKFDAEREVKLAARYRIDSYPTLLFLKADGSEFERILGFVGAKEFMKVADAVKQGKSALTRIAETLAKDPNNPHLRMELARTLASKGRIDDALKEYLWCLDNGPDHDPQFTEMRNTYLLMELAQLAMSDGSVLKALDSRRGDLGKHVSAGDISESQFALYIGLCRVFEEPEAALKAYDKLAKTKSPAMRRKFLPPVLDLLLGEGRYNDIAEAVDVVAEVDATLASAKKSLAEPDPMMKDLQKGMDAEQLADMQRAQKQGLVIEAFAYYQVLVGLGRQNDAAGVSRKLLEYDGSPDMYNALAWSGYLTEKPLRENLEQAQRAYDLSKGESVSIVDTLARIMDVMGQTKNAVKLCEKHLAKTNDPRDRYILMECLGDFD